MAANMYRVGDYVYFETSSTAPYQIRRVEELIKTPNGNVEAKVMCFYRRRDISPNLMALADKHQSAMEEEEEEEEGEVENLTEKERHQLQHRELFLSRQVETLPATHIRGKCSVTLLNETEARLSYLNKEDSFFYSLVYDPQQKTLLADRGEIRVGSKFQAEVPPMLKEGEEGRTSEGLEVLAYNPEHGLSDRQIDQFLIICRSVGTFARALDCSSSVKQPSLHMSAAAASRDITLFHAMDLLHRHNYNMASAIASLVPPSGPVLCRDEMEEWSASEANLFEEALEKYGKDFADIRQDFLPWKSLKNIVEYYYMWKTTDRYVQQKRVKAVEAESKLKQVYIPNYNTTGGTPGKVNGIPGIPGGPGDSPAVNGRPCESCYSQSSSQWYAWGPAHMQCRLCQSCWLYWKKYGGLKYPTRIESLDLSSGNSLERLPAGQGSSHRPHRCSVAGCGKEFKLKAHLARHCATAHGLAMRSGSPRPIVKTRAAFYLCSSPITRLARRLCSYQILRPRHTARNPFQPLNFMAIKQECQTKLMEHGGQMPTLPKLCPRKRGKIVDVSVRLGTPSMACPDWLRPTPKDSIPQPERLAFPPPPRGEDGQFVIARVPAPEKEEIPLKILSSAASPSLLRKRTYDQNGTPDFVGAAPKRRLLSNSLLKTVPDIYSMSSSPSAPLRGAGIVAGLPNVATGLPTATGTGSLLANMTASAATLNTGLVSSVGTAGGLNGRAKVATVTRVGGRKQMISWVDAPDDLYFMATDATRRLRRQLTIPELRRAARHPCCRIHSRLAYSAVPSTTTGVVNPLEQRAVPPPSLLPTTQPQQPESIVILD